MPGVQPLGDGTPQPAYCDGIVEWREAMEAKLMQGKTKQQAVQELVAEKPDLHRAYILAHNAVHLPSPFRGKRI